MKFIIVSNYINHHQIPLANELYKLVGDTFYFIETQPMETDRVKMGWGSEISQLSYLKKYQQEPETCARLLMDADIVVFGGVEDESYIKPRLQAGKIVLRSSERLYREGQWKSISPRGRKKKYEDHTQYANSPVYLLCHGAYVASDFDIVKAYPDKKYQWGYFPKFNQYDMNKLFFKKVHVDDKGNVCVRLLWAGRFLKLKHPEYAVYAAKALRRAGVSFHVDMVGGGEMEETLRKMVGKAGLEQEITFHGFQPPRNVRGFMEEADIFLFTSNYLEGWGAVLNEAMNSACAVVAGHGIGAVPFLIRHEENGLVYRNENRKEFEEQVVRLAKDAALRRRLGERAYQTIATLWNPKEAASRMYKFSKGLLENRRVVQEKGPLSKAEIISPSKGYDYAKGRGMHRTRIYVCHTFYHVYVAMLKEMKLQRDWKNVQNKVYEKADIALSRLSTDFAGLKERLESTGFFGEVIELDEKREEAFPKLAKYRKNYSNTIQHMINRMIFTRLLPKYEAPFLSKVDWKAYEDIYVFCDSDPIGYYLNQNRIYYHAVEDGLDCLKNLDDAYVANHGHFKLKAWFSKHNLIFIMNGWGKYCLDMEINNRAVVPTDCPKFIEVPRKPLEKGLTSQQKKTMIQAFIPDADALYEQLKPRCEGEECMMFLTEPHPVEEEARARVCQDIVRLYGEGFRVLIKPHPRDMIDYSKLCPDCVVLRGRFPIEVLNFFEGLHVKKAISILTTAMDNMDFVEEKINLGASFWDDYEAPELHAFNKKAGLQVANEKEVKG